MFPMQVICLSTWACPLSLNIRDVGDSTPSHAEVETQFLLQRMRRSPPPKWRLTKATWGASKTLQKNKNIPPHSGKKGTETGVVVTALPPTTRAADAATACPLKCLGAYSQGKFPGELLGERKY